MGQLGAGLRKIDWNLSKLPLFEKNFYIEHPAVSSRSDSVADDWRRSKEIIVVGKGIPKPVFSFEEASMPGKHNSFKTRFPDVTILDLTGQKRYSIHSEYVLREVLKQGFTARKFQHLLISVAQLVAQFPFLRAVNFQTLLPTNDEFEHFHSHKNISRTRD